MNLNDYFLLSRNLVGRLDDLFLVDFLVSMIFFLREVYVISRCWVEIRFERLVFFLNLY